MVCAFLAACLSGCGGETGDPNARGKTASTSAGSSTSAASTGASSTSSAPTAASSVASSTPATPAAKALAPLRRTFGGPSDDVARAVTVAPDGSLTLVGKVGEKADFGGGPLAVVDETDAFVARFDASGKHVFSKAFGLEAFGVAHDERGGVVVVGDFGGTVDFGGGPLKAVEGGSMFVVKLDASGAHVWSKAFSAGARAVAVGRDGKVLVAGVANGKVDFGGGPLAPTVEPPMGGPVINGFVLALDASGGHLWSKRFGSAQTSSSSVAVDAQGNVLVAGMTRGSVDFGKGREPLTRDWGVFLAKYGPGGENLWGKVFPGGVDYPSAAIACTPSGEVIFAGSFGKGLDLGGGPLTSKGGASDVFLAKLDADGKHVWSKAFGGKGKDAARAVAVSPGGELGVVGIFQEEADLGGGPMRSAGREDVFMARYDASGAHRASKRLGGPEWDDAWGAAFDGAGTLVAAGRLEGPAELAGGPPLASAGKADVFVITLGP